MCGDAGLDVPLYVDDLFIASGDKAGIILSGVLVYFLMTLGVPFRWDKCRGGLKSSGSAIGPTCGKASWVSRNGEPSGWPVG